MLYRFRDTVSYLSKLPTSTYLTCIWCPVGGLPRSNFEKIFGNRKLESLGYRAALLAVLMFSHFSRTPEHRLVTDTDRQTQRHTTMAESIARAVKTTPTISLSMCMLANTCMATNDASYTATVIYTHTEYDHAQMIIRLKLVTHRVMQLVVAVCPYNCFHSIF